MSAQRRLAAILSADAVGYSRLMAEDEEQTARALSDCRHRMSDLVGQHQGRVVDAPGDNLLAEFGSVVDAVRCAVRVQEELERRNAPFPAERRLLFRIGVNLGDVLVEGDRIIGDGVNIAARLESVAEPGGVCISGTAYDQVKSKLALSYEDLGERTLKNIPDPVRIYRLLPDHALSPRRTRARRGRGYAIALGGVGAVVLALALSWRVVLGMALDSAGLTGPPVNPPLPDKPSIVVLPFTNMSADPEQEYFSDGLTEDLTTGLSRTSTIFVISRNSAFTYKGRSVKVEDVGRELGVRYVLEGSVRKANDRVRITAQLIDAATGFHLWSENYDRELSDIFAVQSEITDEILLALGIEIGEAEFRRIRALPIADLTAHDLFMKGTFHGVRFTRADTLEARRIFEQLAEEHPDFALTHAMIGATYVTEFGMGWNLDPALMERAEEYAQRTLALDPSETAAYITLGAVDLFRGRPEQAIEHLERVMAWDPNIDMVHVMLSGALLQTGRYLAALDAVNKALRLNPRGPTMTWVVMGFVNAELGREDEAVALWLRVVEANPDMIMARIPLAAGGWEEFPEQSREHVREILRVNPDLTAEQAVRLMQGNVDVIGDDMARRFVKNLRLAGLP